MTTNTPAALPTSTCVILARDFTSSTADPERDRWTPGKMRHVIAALDGAPVVLVTDRQTGCAEVGVRLVEVGRARSGDAVLIERTYTDGTTGQVWHYLSDLGETLVPLGGPARAGGVKWTALKTYMDEGRKALTVAQARHGEVEGRAWGRWDVRPQRTGVMVRYTPLTGHSATFQSTGTPWTGRVVGDEIRP